MNNYIIKAILQSDKQTFNLDKYTRQQLIEILKVCIQEYRICCLLVVSLIA